MPRALKPTLPVISRRSIIATVVFGIGRGLVCVVFGVAITANALPLLANAIGFVASFGLVGLLLVAISASSATGLLLVSRNIRLRQDVQAAGTHPSLACHLSHHLGVRLWVSATAIVIIAARVATRIHLSVACRFSRRKAVLSGSAARSAASRMDFRAMFDNTGLFGSHSGERSLLLAKGVNFNQQSAGVLLYLVGCLLVSLDPI